MLLCTRLAAGHGAAAGRAVLPRCAASFPWDGMGSVGGGGTPGWGEGQQQRARAGVWCDLCAARLPRALVFAYSAGFVL